MITLIFPHDASGTRCSLLITNTRFQYLYTYLTKCLQHIIYLLQGKAKNIDRSELCFYRKLCVIYVHAEFAIRYPNLTETRVIELCLIDTKRIYMYFHLTFNIMGFEYSFCLNYGNQA